jgi:hypothetical protein
MVLGMRIEDEQHEVKEILRKPTGFSVRVENGSAELLPTSLP